MRWRNSSAVGIKVSTRSLLGSAIALVSLSFIACPSPLTAPSSSTQGSTTRVATPQFSPASGTYSSDQSVTIRCATSGATIHYTTDGSSPTAAAATYTSPIAVAGDSTLTTIKAVAVKSGMSDSDIAASAYTISYVSAVWARTVTAGSANSQFVTIALDGSGNVYAIGSAGGTGTYTFGSGVNLTGTSSYNPVLVKYDSTGTALWARTVTVMGNGGCVFNSVAVDPSSGDIYVVGYFTESISGGISYTFGPGVTLTAGVGSTLAVVVKYDPNGVALWARTIVGTSGTTLGASRFSSVATDGSSNVYVGGYINGTISYDFGNGASAAGNSSNSNVVLVKYNSGGTAQWACSATEAGGLGVTSSGSQFSSVATDSSGNVYAVGYIYDAGTYTFGTGISTHGWTDGLNALVVKYDANGTALWAQSVVTGSQGYSAFTSIAVDASGDPYVVGYVQNTGTYTFGTGVSLLITPSSSVLVKYGPTGIARWAVTGAPADSIVIDTSGNLYTAGSSSANKCNAAGTQLWARSASSGSSDAQFNSVAVDSSNNVYVAGVIEGTGTYTFGPGVTAAGTNAGNYAQPNSDFNVVVAKYR